MKNTQNLRGATAPLFDRIKAPGFSGDSTQVLLNSHELSQSVMTELKIMLNTRCTVRRSLYESHIDDVLIYGMPDLLGFPDFSYFDAANAQEWGRVASLLEITIQAIEPRFQNVKVDIQAFDAKTQELHINVSGLIKSGPLTQDIRFPLALSKNDSHPYKSKAA
ncbi:Type VI secretion system baseplate subunit TssE [Candidatus Bealeia paramacronuclearis]|uniref:Type VI secretion system baseplate subunit TssE n=1 Tax=Candidatus Bealeia paramacronuclearis TaxID=1921001 RepID=A0ABZ2C3V0_9PROT|nr:Type VI secretion system baseplate subunit TssE [Candidatus Bealeia paramacronuclearis]